jgi:hydroxylamine reductase
MFCNQCQEAAKGTGCTGIKGVCGKPQESSNLQDVLIFSLKGLSVYAVEARMAGINLSEVDKFVTEGLFSTITNVNFTTSFFTARIQKALELRQNLKNQLVEKGFSPDLHQHPEVIWTAETEQEIIDFAASFDNHNDARNEDIHSLRSLILFGLKGIAAYADHALNLGQTNNEVFAFMQKALAALCDDSLTLEQNIALVLETGKYGVDVMALLDKANTTAYGNPEITKVNIGVRKNPGILISGHDLKDLEELLAQTEGTGVDVYTHSEMLPAHYYPAFKKYSHFAGNYGNAWWKQTEEFESFNGPIVFTTNCLVPPKKTSTYADRVYTTGVVGFDGLKHIDDRKNGQPKDFSEVIAHAKRCASPIEIETGEIVGGFAHNQVMAVADKVVDAVKTGAIKKFFVMAGCDGRSASRNYYSEFAEQLPKDTVILTAGCAKYRYNKLPLGDIAGIPRVLDAGQCNDSFSLAMIALKLKEVFGLEDINDLPIAYNIAWYEQKAVIVLLALLHLGVKNIHLGPTLPAFLSPNVAKVLVENFGIAGIKSVEEDLKIFMPELAMMEK